MDKIENADNGIVGTFVTGLVTGLLLGSAAGFTWAVIDLGESVTTPVAAQAAEVNTEPSVYETLMKDPAKYCSGHPLGISGSYAQPYTANLYCVKYGQLGRYSYYKAPLKGGGVDLLRLSKSRDIGALRDGLLLPQEAQCHSGERMLGANLEFVEVEGIEGQRPLYQLWCASGHTLYSVSFGQDGDQAHYREMSSLETDEDFTVFPN